MASKNLSEISDAVIKGDLLTIDKMINDAKPGSLLGYPSDFDAKQGAVWDIPGISLLYIK